MAWWKFLNLNALLSVADPELRRFAQRIWASIPDNSSLKTETFERFFGVFKSWAEIQARGKGPIGDIIEKLTDVGDFAVRGGGPKAVKADHDWMDRFFTEAIRRIEKAVDPELEFEKAQLEFSLRSELLKIIEEKRRESAGPAKSEPSIDWAKIQSQYSALGERIGKFTAKAVNFAEKADEKAASKLNKLADWLERRA
mgnify:CR=1 FL=1